MTRFKYYSNYLACLLGTLIVFELCWIGAKYVIEGEVVHTYLDHFIAEKLGRSRQALSDKIQGKTEFLPSEIRILCELLHLSDDDRRLIFLI